MSLCLSLYLSLCVSPSAFATNTSVASAFVCSPFVYARLSTEQLWTRVLRFPHPYPPHPPPWGEQERGVNHTHTQPSQGGLVKHMNGKGTRSRGEAEDDREKKEYEGSVQSRELAVTRRTRRTGMKRKEAKRCQSSLYIHKQQVRKGCGGKQSKASSALQAASVHLQAKKV